MWKITGSIRYQLYVTYALIMVLVTAIYVGAFYFYESKQITTGSVKLRQEWIFAPPGFLKAIKLYKRHLLINGFVDGLKLH